MTNTDTGTGKRVFEAQLPSDDGATSLEGYSTGSSNPEAFLAQIMREYPDFAALIEAKTLKETKALVADVDPRRYTPLVALLKAASFHFGKLGCIEDEFAASRAWVEIVRLADPKRLDSFFENSQPRNLGDALSELGDWFSKQGHLDMALKTLEEAERCYEDDAALRAQAGITRPSEADILFGLRDFRSLLYAQLSRVHADMGNSTEAERYNALARKHSQRAATPEDRYENALSNARGAEQVGDFESALGGFSRALDLSFTLGSTRLTSRNVVEPLRGIASVHARLGLHRTAVQRIRRCIELNTQTAHRGRLLSDYRALARSLEALDDFKGAHEALDEALRLCAVKFDPGSERAGLFVWVEGEDRYRLTRYDSAWRILRQRAHLAAGYKDRAAAIADLNWAVEVVERLRERVLSDESRIGAQEEMMGVFDDLIALHADEFAATGDQASAAAAFITIERAKSRVLAEMLSEQELPPPRGAPADLVAEEERLMAEATALETMIEKGEGDPLVTADRLEAVLAALNATWDQIAAAAPDGGPEYASLRRADPVSVGEIAALLREVGGRVCLVSYYALPDRVLIVALDPETEVLQIVAKPVGRATLRDWVAVNPDNPPSPDLRLHYWSLDFGPLLIEPLAAIVPPGAGICFAPHDALHSLPLHALEATEGAAPLIETTAVSYSPSASVLRFILRRPASVSNDHLVLGCPDRPDEVLIEHTRVEAEAVAGTLDCTPHLGPDATCALAVERMPGARFVHIACHHRFDAQSPMQSALLLSDGDLTAQQILELRIAAELVTISACQSGVSLRRPGDELMGTVRALLYAGARSVMVSLWNAYDEATAHLMREFYSELAKSGLEKRQALRVAAMRVRGAEAATAHWAPFVLFGDWR